MSGKNQGRENPPTKRKVGQKYILSLILLSFYRVLRGFEQFIFVPDKNHFGRDKNQDAYFCPADKNPSLWW